jgi:AP-1 complex subunit mu
MCRAEFSLPSVTSEEATPEKKAPIRVKFEIPYFTVSGIQVPHQLLLCICNLACSELSLAVLHPAPIPCYLLVQVRYLKVIEKSGYQALPWVRYITMAGEYELRLI